MNEDICRVWGVANGDALEYSLAEDGRWDVLVPANLQDGQYAVEIFAQNRIGAIGHWTGILYMHQGQATLHLFSKKYNLWFLPSGTEFHLISGKPTFIIQPQCQHIQFKGATTYVEYTDRER